jgi:hypothetical protein
LETLPFLREIASLLLQSGKYNLTDTCVVFPNKRARLYLGRHLGELAEKPVWAPRYLTISEMMESMSGYIYADRLTLLFELYEVFRSATGTSESFDSFYPYSEALLADFDEIDKYMADAGDLFGNLSGLKAMENRFSYLTEDQIAAIRKFWDTFDPENISAGQKTFLTLWDALPVMYRQLRERLQGKGMAYEGMAYRKVAEDVLGAGASDKFRYGRYLFIGFNALNTCEEKLFRFLKNAGRAEFFWDYDTWYANNEIHEAGHFIRKNIRNFPPAVKLPVENLVNPDKSIVFLPVSSNTGQAETLGYIFEKLDLTGDADFEKTALVLADENMLLPVLYAIPDYVKNVNITMSYPVSGSAVFNLVDALYELVKNSKIQGDRVIWYYKDMLSVMGNPLLKLIYKEKYEAVRRLALERRIYLSSREAGFAENEDIIFNHPEDIASYLLRVFEFIIRRSLGGADATRIADPVMQEILYQTYTFLTRMADILAGVAFRPGRDVLFRLIRKMLKMMHIPFSGEPLSGLQVLGILETRTLDFENVIILSMNEGVMPKSSAPPSFIPYNLRYGFGLPTPEHHDSIAAYYFYRLIQRARNVMLVYNSSSGGLRTGERSRFLHQLFYERPCPVSEITPVTLIEKLPVSPIRIEKNTGVAQALHAFTGKGGRTLSPSALNEFLNCPLQFYFHYIAGLPKPEEVAEEIDARVFGNLLHKAMRILYTGFGTSEVTGQHLDLLLKNEKHIEEALDMAFKEEFASAEDSSGRRQVQGFNLIARQVIKTYIINLIRADREAGAFSIAGLEQRYAATIRITVQGRELEVNTGGIVDRIDKAGGQFRILDYKTGASKSTFSNVEALFDAGDKPRNDAVFQVFLYSLMVDRMHPDADLVPGLYFVRDSHSRDFSSAIRYGQGAVLNSFSIVKEEFESLLRIHLERLFNLEEPFTQTSRLKVCQYCPYAMICRREGGE